MAAWLGLTLPAAAGLCAGLASVRAAAQGLADGVLRGTVRDERGVRLEGGAVRLVSRETGQVLVAGTDSAGEFGFLSVPAGEYVLAVRQRLAPVWVGSVRVLVGESSDAELDVAVQGGGVVLSGSGGVALVGRRAAAGLMGVSEEQRDTVVPVANWGSVAGVLSGARDEVLADGGAAQNAEGADEDSRSVREEREAGDADGAGADVGRAAGGEGSDAGALGVSRREAGFGLGGVGAGRVRSEFGQGAVGRLGAAMRGFSAQSGGSAEGGRRATQGLAGAVGFASGLHGSGYFRARESGWAAVNPFAVVTTYRAGQVGAALARPADAEMQFGGAAGGVARVPGLGERWKLGLVGSVEGRVRAQTLFSTPETSGFYQLSGTQRALLANRGVSAGAIGAALNYLGGLTGAESLRGVQWTGLGRVTMQPGPADRMGLEYRALRSSVPTTAGAQVAEGVVSRGVGSVGVSTIGADAGTVRWVHVLGPRWTNEVRGEVSRDDAAEAPGAGSAGLPAVGPGGFAPEVNIAPDGFSFGTPASLGRVAYPDERRVGVAETSVWRFGRHLVTLGGEWARVDDRVLSAANLQGTFSYDSGTTGGYAGGLVDWITDYTFNVHAYPNGACPSVTAAVHYFCFHSYSQEFANVESEFETHQVAGFVEDSVRVRPGLKVTIGARWEYELLPFPIAPNAALDAALATAGAETSAAYGSTASFPEDRNNVGPRVAVNWSPGAGKGARRGWFTVEAGYGMFFGRLPGATLNAALTDTGMVQSTTKIRITPKTEVDCPQVANQGFGYVCSFPYAPVGVAAVAETSGATVFARRFRLPVVQRGMFALEREVGARVRVRAEYATGWAVQLPETTDLNIAPSTSTVSYVVQGGDRWPGLWTGQSFQVPLYSARRTDKIGPVTAIVSNANATYHRGTAEAILRGWHGWGARGSFTFSRAIDYGPQVGATPRQDGQFDPFTNGYDKGRSSLDRPWEAGGAVTWRSTWERGEAWQRGLLDGWGLSTVGRAGSGAPYSYVIYGGTRLAGGYESVNGSGGATYLPTVGRNTLRLPKRSKVDLRLAKEMGLGGARRLELRADALNLLNTVSLSRVESRAFLVGAAGSVGGMTPLTFQDAAAVAAEGVSTPAFGTPLSSTTGLSRERTIEVGMRMSF